MAGLFTIRWAPFPHRLLCLESCLCSCWITTAPISAPAACSAFARLSASCESRSRHSGSSCLPVSSSRTCFPAGLYILAIAFVPLILIIEKQIVFLIIRYLHSRGYGVQNALVYGAGFTGRSVLSALFRSPKLGLRPVAIVDDNEEIVGQDIYASSYRHEVSAPVIAGPLSRDLIQKWDCSQVVIGIPSLSRQRVQEIAAEAFAAGAEVAFVPQLSFGSDTPAEYVDIDGVLLASIGQATRKRLYEAAKRAFDLVAALFLLVCSAPLWAVLAILIRRDSKGPVLFSQMRVGRGGKLFRAV